MNLLENVVEERFVQPRFNSVVDELRWYVFQELIQPMLVSAPVELRVEPHGRFPIDALRGIPGLTVRQYGSDGVFMGHITFEFQTGCLVHGEDTLTVLHDYDMMLQFIDYGVGDTSKNYVRMKNRNDIKQEITDYFNRHKERKDYKVFMVVIERCIHNGFVKQSDVIDAMCETENTQALMEVIKMNDMSVFNPPNIDPKKFDL